MKPLQSAMTLEYAVDIIVDGDGNRKLILRINAYGDFKITSSQHYRSKHDEKKDHIEVIGEISDITANLDELKNSKQIVDNRKFGKFSLVTSPINLEGYQPCGKPKKITKYKGQFLIIWNLETHFSKEELDEAEEI